MKHALGIDIGSTTVKVTVINESHYYLRREKSWAISQSIQP